MTIQTVQSAVTIEWDDSVVIVFSFADASGTKQFCGFVHLILSVQGAVGSQTQVSSVLQTLQQQAVQASADPATWVDTIKTAARNQNTKLTIVFDDALNQLYTTQTSQNFQLQQLFSLAG